MPEYIVTPDKKELPSGTFLLEELHRRGFPVEINLKGSSDKWEAIRFWDPGPPEIECQLSRDSATNRLGVSVSTDAPPHAGELQMFLVDLLLKELGGQVDNTSTRERYTAQEFGKKIRVLHGSSPKGKDIFWIAFSWGVVLLGGFLYFSIPPDKKIMDLIVVSLAFLSAAGQTYTYFKS